MDANAALAKLTEISNQVEEAVLFDASGAPLASTLEGDRAQRMAEAAARLLETADETVPPAGARVAQVEAATRDGSVFVVREGDRAVAATTAPTPVIGLVMYDLRTCLRSLEKEPA